MKPTYRHPIITRFLGQSEKRLDDLRELRVAYDTREEIKALKTLAKAKNVDEVLIPALALLRKSLEAKK